MARLAEREGNAARAERSAYEEANRQAQAEALARGEADQARAAAQAETYRALLSQVMAQRAGRQPGWRDHALAGLARLALMPTPRRDLPELRTEAAASLATPDIQLVTRIELPGFDLRSLAFSPDSRSLVTVRFEKGLDFWDVRGQRHLAAVKDLKVTDTECDQVVYLPLGQGLAVATRDRGVVFTYMNFTSVTRAAITRGARQPTRLAIDADGHRIAVAWTDGGGITVHDTATGALLDTFKDSLFALSPDGHWLARQENDLVVLHAIGLNEPQVVLGRADRIRSFDFSPDGAMLAGASFDHSTILWDVTKREKFGVLRGHREAVNDVAFSPDGKWIATVGGDYTARIWEARTGQLLATLPGSAWVGQVVWSPDSEYLATTTDSHQSVFLYRITGRNHVQQWLTGHRFELTCVAAHPRLTRFATFGVKELITWDVSARRTCLHLTETEPLIGTRRGLQPGRIVSGDSQSVAFWRSPDPGPGRGLGYNSGPDRRG